MFNLPNDIKKYIKKNIFKRVIPCFVLIILSLFAVYFNYDYLKSFGAYNPSFVLLFCILFSCLATGFPLKLIDQSYKGKIINVRAKKIINIDKGFRTHFTRRTYVLLDIADSRNNIITYIVNNSKLDEHGYDEIYNKGDRVFHVYGTKYLGVFPLREDYSVCIICGAKNHHTSGKCDICKHTLITQKHIKP